VTTGSLGLGCGQGGVVFGVTTTGGLGEGGGAFREGIQGCMFVLHV
jgi:hypothetical protein